MFSILTQLASSNNPSGLAELLLSNHPEFSHHHKNQEVLLFFSESWRSNTYQEVTRYMPILAKELEPSVKIDYQWLRTFLKAQRPELFITKPSFIGFHQFEIWLTTEASSSCSFTKTLEKKCKTLNFHDDLYKELCLLAPFGRYIDGVKTENSYFELDTKIIAWIPLLLKNYRTWMIANNKFDSAVSNLFPKQNQPTATKSYSHIVWDGTTEISPNVLNYLDSITKNITICVSGAIKKTEHIISILRSSIKNPNELKLWLETQHKTMKNDKDNAEFPQVLIAALLSRTDEALQQFVEASIHHDRYFPLFSVVRDIDLEKSYHIILLKKILGYLGDYIEKISFLHINNRDFYIMIQNLLDILYEKQNEAAQTTVIEINNIIFSLAILFIEELLKANSHHYALYRKLLRVFEYSTIKDIQDLMEIFVIFSRVHHEIFMKTTANVDASDENTIMTTWDIMRDSYSVLFILSGGKKFSGAFQIAISTYDALKQHCKKFPIPTRPEYIDWYAISYANVIVSFVAELDFTHEQKNTLPSDFFATVFDFFSRNTMNHQWSLDCQRKILCNLMLFFMHSVKYYFDRDELNLVIWQELRRPFDSPAFDVSLKNNVIRPIIIFIEGVSTHHANRDTIVRDGLQKIHEIQQALVDITRIRSVITLNQYTLYGAIRENSALTSNATPLQRRSSFT